MAEQGAVRVSSAGSPGIIDDGSAGGGPTLIVHRQWNGWQTARVRLTDLEDVHWRQPAGAPRPLIHGYIACSRLAPGALAHACVSKTGPHRLLVCVLKSHTVVAVFQHLTRLAGAQVRSGGAGNAHSAIARITWRAFAAKWLSLSVITILVGSGLLMLLRRSAV